MKSLLLALLFVSAPALHAAKPLPLVEVPSTAGASDTLVVIVSGDGGWASIDKAIAKVLADNGMPVVGLNALQYFWTKRTPDEASRDLQTIVDTYLAKWKKSHVVFVGYSRGADVLPALVARLAPDRQAKMQLLALLSPSRRATFEFHMTDWFHDASGGMPVKPELDKLSPRPVLCLWGIDDKESLCSGLAGPGINVVTLKGAHHFDGGYEQLAQIILQQLR